MLWWTLPADANIAERWSCKNRFADNPKLCIHGIITMAVPGVCLLYDNLSKQRLSVTDKRNQCSIKFLYRNR